MTMNDTWGFKTDDHHWKNSETLIRNLVDIASKGGNYLLNVGPTRDGLIPAPSLERLAAVGAWMKVNSPAIYGTSASPFSRLPWGRCTQKTSGNTTTLFLHVFNWPTNGQLVVPGLKNRIKSATLLATHRSLKTQTAANGVTIQVPATAPDPISSTIALKLQGAPQVEAVWPTQAADGSLTLAASDAQLRGELRYETGGGKDNIGYWTRAEDQAAWTFTVRQPGKFTVTAELAALGTGRFEVLCQNQQLTGTAPVTGDYARFQTVPLGSLTIASAGQVTLTVRPVAAGWQPINLKTLHFQPQP